MMPQFLPWQSALASDWLTKTERFSHAWVIYGQEGIGKFQFAHAAAASLLCENPQNGLACGHCQSCRWIDLQSHPDLRIVVPEALVDDLGLGEEKGNSDSDKKNLSQKISSQTDSKDKKKNLSQIIRITQLRELDQKQFFTLSSHRGGVKVLIIYPAQTMNEESANALLKILEEPVGNTVFLIVTHSLRKLLPTIISRCQRLNLPLPAHNQAIAWLQTQGVETPDLWLSASGGTPIRALELSRSDTEPVHYWLAAFVEHIAHAEMPEIKHFVDLLMNVPGPQWIGTLQRLCFDLHLIHYGMKAHYFPALQSYAHKIAYNMTADKISDLYKWLTDEQKTAAHPFNKALFIQAILQRFIVICIAGKKR